MPRPLLIVFGLNGSLLQRCRPAVAANLNPPENIEQHTVGIQKVFVRPSAKDGLKKLVDEGNSVAIWSSTTLKNTEPIVHTVWSEKDHPFSFIWSRDHTKPDNYRRQTSLGDSETEFATLKDLNMIWNYRLGVTDEHRTKFGADFNFGPKNTVVVDDEPSKTRAHADNLLWIPQYSVEDNLAGTVDPSLGFDQALELLLGELSEIDDVRDVLPKKIVVKNL